MLRLSLEKNLFRKLLHYALQLFFYIFLFSTPINFAAPLYAFNDKNAETEFYHLIHETRCVVCQNQNLADSNAPLARDLRNKIYAMVNAHQSEREIEDYLVKRYGEFILLRPRFNQTTWLLWLFPGFLLCIAAALLFRYNHKHALPN